MADLETIKVIIRSVLISSPHPLNVEDLRREYRTIDGQDCPFHALGYRSWIAFLQAIPDIVQVGHNGICRPVTTKETAHIQALVATQKKPQKKRRPYRPPQPQRYGSSYFNSAGPTYHSSASSSHGSSYRNSQTRNDKDMDQFFKTAQEAKQKRRMEDIENEKQTIMRSANSENKADSSVQRRVIYGPDLDSDSSTDSFCDGFDYVRPYSPNHGTKEPSRAEDAFHSGYATKFPDELEENALFSSSSGKISDVMKKNLRTILSHHPDGVWACVLPELYQKEFGFPLDWPELGYNSICQMAHDLPDVFICKRIDNGDWKLFDAQQPLPVAYVHDPNSSKAPVVPETICNKIGNLAKDFPAGICGMEFAQKYREKYKKSLLSEVTGFKEVEALLISLQDSFILLKYHYKQCFVYPALNKPVDDSPLLNLDQKIIQDIGLFPEEVLGPEDHYPGGVLPSDLEEGVYMELVVAEVYNPHRFWIQLRKTNSELNQLMDELQVFYGKHGDQYKMPESTIFRGQCCAAQYCGEWHRACVTSVNEADVEVFYVDYGTLFKVPKHELCFMHRDFSALPKQAIRASLCGIQPPNGKKKFSDESSKAFLNLVSGKPLVGLVYQINFDVPSLQLFLIDTSGPTDIHLNDVLVEEKHADFIPEITESSAERAENPIDSHDNTNTESQEPKLTSPHNLQSLNVSGQFSQSAPSPTWNGTRPSYLPPPGFYSPNIYPLVPNINPALAYSQVMNAMAIQQQQQQQQALMFAMYQNWLQQNMTANLLGSQQNMTANLLGSQQNMTANLLGSQQNMTSNLIGSQQKLGSVAGNPWAGNPLVYSQSQPVTPKDQMTSPIIETNCSDSSMAKMGSAATPTSSGDGNASNQGSLIAVKEIESTDCTESGSLKAVKKSKKKKKVSPGKTFVSDSEFSGTSPNYNSKQHDEEIKLAAVSSSVKDSIVKPRKNQVNVKIIAPVSKINTINSLLSSENDKVVDCWEELVDNSVYQQNQSSDNADSESCISVMSGVPENSNSNTDVEQPPSIPFNFWKEIDIDGKRMHLFNIAKSGYISTDELARQCTSFSNSSSIMRVIDAIGIKIPFLKLTRPANLTLFSALDGCDDDVVSKLGLMRNKKNGSIIGTFILAPIHSIPSILMVLGICEDSIIEEFQNIRDQFDDDPYWR